MRESIDKPNNLKKKKSDSHTKKASKHILTYIILELDSYTGKDEERSGRQFRIPSFCLDLRIPLTDYRLHPSFLPFSANPSGNTSVRCHMCQHNVLGTMQTHRRSDSHCVLRRFLHPRCRVCAKDFKERGHWDRHRVAPDHIRRVHARGRTEVRDNAAGV